MRKYLLFIFLFSFSFSFAQAPLLKKWDYRFGGTGNDGFNGWFPPPALNIIRETKDKGIIIAGYSNSGISGDKTQDLRGVVDYWIVKVDSFGIKQWDKRFGGTGEDLLMTMQLTSDNGFILGGWTLSGIGADKSQANWGDFDYWIVKTDSLGNMQWEKDFGGTKIDELNSVEQTSDGGYILGGESNSRISGDKTEDCKDILHLAFDYWVIKTDSLGNKIWDRTFGGDGNDDLKSVHQTSDGGYILCGCSFSNISGDKTQACWGGNDYWVVKIDSVGNKLWDKRYGGTFEDQLWSSDIISDGGFILGGYSTSSISGDKTEPNRDIAGHTSDLWIIKIDSAGNKKWDKTFGGTASEDGNPSIVQIADSGFLLAGTSYSGISGDKTQVNLSNEQSWIIKTDSIGNKIWDKTLQTIGAGDDESANAIELSDGCYLFANFTYGGIGGDKTQASQGGDDYWISKYCPTGPIPVAVYTSAITEFCQNSCLNFTNASQNSISYQWFFPGGNPSSDTAANPNGICYSTSGTYDVTLIAMNSNGSDTLTLLNYLTVYPQIPFSPLTQNGDTLFSIPGYSSYTWFNDSTLIAFATNYFYVTMHSGNYSVVVTDNNGCSATAQLINVISSVNNLQSNENNFMYQYINGNLFLDINSLLTGPLLIQVTDAFGKEVFSRNIYLKNGKNDIVLPIENISTGIYFISFRTDKQSITKRFLKE